MVYHFFRMQKMIIVILILMCSGQINSNNANENVRCTPFDKRAVQSSCQNFYRTKELHCDQMNLTKLLNAKEVGGYITERYSNPDKANKLYWNDSCVQTISKGNLLYYKAIILLNCDLNEINKIEDSAFEKLTKLNELILSNNKIQFVKVYMFKGLGKLKTLDLANNFISAIEDNSFLDLKTLHVLNLERNGIVEIISTQLRGLHALRILNLSNNKLTNIEKALFTSTHNLQKVDFTNNQIRSIDSNTFKSLKNLRAILLANNQLKIPNPTWFHSVRGSPEVDISLEKNPWTCNEDAQEYWHFIVKEGYKNTKKFDVVCTYPAKAKNLTMVDLTVYYENNNISALRDLPGDVTTTTTTKFVITTIPDTPKLPKPDQQQTSSSIQDNNKNAPTEPGVIILKLTKEQIIIFGSPILVLVIVVIFLCFFKFQPCCNINETKHKCENVPSCQPVQNNLKQSIISDVPSYQALSSRDSSVGTFSHRTQSISTSESQDSGRFSGDFLPTNEPEFFSVYPSSDNSKNINDRSETDVFEEETNTEYRKPRIRFGNRHSSCHKIDEENQHDINIAQHEINTAPKKFYEPSFNNTERPININ